MSLELNDAWAGVAGAAAAHFQHQRDLRKTSITPGWKRAITRKRRSPLELGHDRVKNIYKTLAECDDFLKLPRTQNQSRVQSFIIASAAACIYGPCFEANRLAIMRKNKWNSNDLTPYVVVIMPRRSGKTTATAQVALAFLLNIEKLSIVVRFLSRCAAAETHGSFRSSPRPSTNPHSFSPKSSSTLTTADTDPSSPPFAYQKHDSRSPNQETTSASSPLNRALLTWKHSNSLSLSRPPHSPTQNPYAPLRIASSTTRCWFD